MSNAEIADQLASLAQLLSTKKGNPHKIRAYRRAAAGLRIMPESIDSLVQQQADLTRIEGVGEAIGSAIREIVLTGHLRQLEALRSEASPELAAISQHPRLDPKRVLRVYKKLKISTVEELRAQLENGAIEQALGPRMAQHVRQGLADSHAMLLYQADDLRAAVERFLLGECGVRRAEVVGAYRRRVEVLEELAFVVETDDFASVVAKVERYGGRSHLLSSSRDSALFALPSKVQLRLDRATPEHWGLALVAGTGSEAHLLKLTAVTGPLDSAKSTAPLPTEAAWYASFGLTFIPPELRGGHDEVERAGSGTLPVLVTAEDIRGDLHAHSTSSDGIHSIEQMAAAAAEKGYEYTGISDHSQSLRIARGLPVADLLKQLRDIDRLNGRLQGFRVLKSSEVDILADGSLDYSDEVLRELDYTVCSIHSRFGLGKMQQTERIMKAMDNPYFNILGHATGRLLLRRPGYEIDVERVIEHARQRGCFFEMNSSPDRLDLSAENARLAREAGIKVAVTSDAHSMGEFDNIADGIDQARRAGLERTSVLNCLTWSELSSLFAR